jgi:hypothetical protein
MSPPMNCMMAPSVFSPRSIIAVAQFITVCSA